MAPRDFHTPVNADGFGMAWYGERAELNLPRHHAGMVGQQPQKPDRDIEIASLAHVRASTGTATSRNNCHPFAVGRWSFMHNGQFGGYDQYYRRHADALIPDDYYPHRKGCHG